MFNGHTLNVNMFVDVPTTNSIVKPSENRAGNMHATPSRLNWILEGTFVANTPPHMNPLYIVFDHIHVFT